MRRVYIDRNPGYRSWWLTIVVHGCAYVRCFRLPWQRERS